jgi:ABC-type branched-subunit amino acid transport system substrate-binding protein
MRGRAVLLGAAAVVASGAAAATFAAVRDPAPLRVGVMVNCVGFFRGYEDLMLAGSELPFIERGAHLRSADLSDGVTDVTLPGGRRARLVIGCDEGGEFTTEIAAARRLVEKEHADVVVGGTWPGDGIVLGQVAQRYPRVAFVAAMTGPDEVTLERQSPNLFRVRPSYAQQAAGLGFYAYHDLGWRHATVLVEDDEEGWDESAAFAAEFCAAGGRLDRRVGFPLALKAATARQLARNLDGVAVFAAGVTDPAVVLPALRNSFGENRVIVGLGVSSDQRAARLLPGVVSPARVSSPIPAFAERLAAVFAGLPTDSAESAFTVDFAATVEAVLRAAAHDGDLRTSLGQLELRVPGGALRIDRDGQAVVPVTLVRNGARGPHAVAHLEAVPPLLGGLLSRSSPPSRVPAPCRRAPTPAYAHSLVSRR